MPPYLVIDACVLMSGVLRPWMLTLAQRELFKPIWSERIGSEWRRNAARIWNIAPDVLEREWAAMQVQFPDANISNWQPSQSAMPALKYSDPKDWHVIEAGWLAKQAHPDQPVGIVTLNIKDFSRSELRQRGLDLFDPDRLLSTWFTQNADLVTQSLEHVVEELIVNGRRHQAPLSTFLKRDRLFRLNKLLTAQRP